VGGYATWSEPRWLDVPELAAPVPSLPSALEGYTVALVSDLHGTRLDAVHETLAEALQNLRRNLLKGQDPGPA
jgi:hypothetical protein